MPKRLTKCQLDMMKCIWEAGQDLCYQELMERLERLLGKEYQRSTVITFLRQLIDKRYIYTYRIGRRGYIRPIITEEEFRNEHAREEIDRWYHGRVSDFMLAYINAGGITETEVSRIRELLNNRERETKGDGK